ncbi:MAG: hypothetical protein AAF320_03945 [Myxococcota bacterium]
MGKRISLAELEQLEQEDLHSDPPEQPPPSNDKLQKSAKNSSQDKSDFVKVCITMPPNLFDQLENIAHAKRREGKPYTKSALIREALKIWLISMEK